MAQHALESITNYVHKKGISYFLNEPSAEDVVGFKGYLFDDNGAPIVSNIISFAGIPANENLKNTASL